MTETAKLEALEPCPFCGSNPHHGLMKVEYCQLHGDPFQRFRVWCPRGCAEKIGASQELAIAAWNTRAISSLSPPTGGWKDAKPDGLEAAIADFKAKLPGWWFSVGECQVSCDASCAPTVESEHIGLIQHSDDPFDSGFHADLRQPSTLAEALRTVMRDALSEIEVRTALTKKEGQ